LTVDEFQRLSSHLHEPFKTMALVQVCLVLRVSELLALRWADVDWMGARLKVEHGIVNQHLDTVKTEESRKTMSLFAVAVSAGGSGQSFTPAKIGSSPRG
jgi:integrase